MSDTRTESGSGGGKPKSRVLTLGPPRHACNACGHCCSGWAVHLADEGERERVERQALELGVQDPVVGGALRQAEGHCVFLGQDRLCRIHARFGEEEKPLACQLFPRRSVRAEDGVRFGVDPGCSSSWQSFRNGPLISLWLIPTDRDEHLAPSLATAERRLIALARVEGMTLAELAGEICDEPLQAPGCFPAGFAGRLLEQLARVAEVLDDPDNGPFLRGDLTATIALVRRLPDPTLLARPIVVPPELDAFCLDVFQRSLFLRVGGIKLPPIGQALVLLGGMLACLLADPRLEGFGPALAAWSRVMRLDASWPAFLPDPESAVYLLTGERASPGEVS